MLRGQDSGMDVAALRSKPDIRRTLLLTQSQEAIVTLYKRRRSLKADPRRFGVTGTAKMSALLLPARTPVLLNIRAHGCAGGGLSSLSSLG